MTDIEVIAQIKFESDMGLHGQWAEGLWNQVPLTERLALTNNVESFVAALNAAGLAVVPKEPTEVMRKAANRFMDPCNLKPEHENMDRFYAGGIYKAMLSAAENNNE